MTNEKPKSSSDVTGKFTLDAPQDNDARIPSISRLLNRKSLGLGPALTDEQSRLFRRPSKEEFTRSLAERRNETGAPEQIVFDTRIDMPRSMAPAAPPDRTDESLRSIAPSVSSPASPRIKPASRRTHSAPPLREWNLEKISRSQDPMARGISHLFARGARCALFLSIDMTAKANELTPCFSALAGINSKARAPLWAGLRWDPTFMPELWNAIIRTGYESLPALGPFSSAIGLATDETAIMVRVGPASACRGVIIFFSPTDLSASVVGALGSFTDLPAQVRAA